MLSDTGAACRFAKPLLARAGFRPADLVPLCPRLLAISAIAGATMVSGCAHHSVTHDLHPGRHKGMAPPVQTAARVARSPDQPRSINGRTRWPDAALLAPQRGPDCEFKGANSETMDADELARLKTEYERHCYQDAEKAARDRLNTLQAAVRRMRD
jgi:hypothetical protein